MDCSLLVACSNSSSRGQGTGPICISGGDYLAEAWQLLVTPLILLSCPHYAGLECNSRRPQHQQARENQEHWTATPD